MWRMGNMGEPEPVLTALSAVNSEMLGSSCLAHAPSNLPPSHGSHFWPVYGRKLLEKQTFAPLP